MRKTIICLIVGFLLGIVVTVGATFAYDAFEINYSNESSEVSNVGDAIDELYDMEELYKIYYVGELNANTGNNGVVTSTFDIKKIYDKYGELTINNFVYKIEGVYDHWNSNPEIIGGKTLVKSYNSETGILTISNCYQINNFSAGFYGKVYLVPNLSNIK